MQVCRGGHQQASRNTRRRVLATERDAVNEARAATGALAATLGGAPGELSWLREELSRGGPVDRHTTAASGRHGPQPAGVPQPTALGRTRARPHHFFPAGATAPGVGRQRGPWRTAPATRWAETLIGVQSHSQQGRPRPGIRSRRVLDLDALPGVRSQVWSRTARSREARVVSEFRASPPSPRRPDSVRRGHCHRIPHCAARHAGAVPERPQLPGRHDRFSVLCAPTCQGRHGRRPLRRHTGHLGCVSRVIALTQLRRESPGKHGAA